MNASRIQSMSTDFMISITFNENHTLMISMISSTSVFDMSRLMVRLNLNVSLRFLLKLGIDHIREGQRNTIG